MKYQELVDTLAERTRWPKEAVRDILEELPEVLKGMKAGESVRTPLGGFHMTHRKERKIKVGKIRSADNKGLARINAQIGEGKATRIVPEKAIVRLRPGKSLTVEPGSRQWTYITTPAPKSKRKKRKSKKTPSDS